MKRRVARAASAARGWVRHLRDSRAAEPGRIRLKAWAAIFGLVMAWLIAGLAPSHAVVTRDRYTVTSDKVRLRLIEAGPATGPVMLFVPGWTMPAWIWRQQIEVFARHYHVIAMDPRGQGASDIPSSGYDHLRRGQDIGEVIAQFGPRPVLLIGWSLGVLDALSYVHTYGDRQIAGLVLVDNSVGEDPAPVPPPPSSIPARRPPHAEMMRRFVTSMFRHAPDQAWLEQLIQSCLRTPEPAAKVLLAYPVPRQYWKEAVLSTSRPVLYVVRPRWAAQAASLVQHRPGTETELFADAGHALFVDEPARFNAMLDDFIRRRIWP